MPYLSQTIFTAVTAALLVFTGPIVLIAHAAPVQSPIAFQPDKGVANALLGQADSQVVAALNKLLGTKPAVSGRDDDYEGQVVYYFYYGAKDKNNSHPLQVYSDAKHKVFIFEINSSRFVTSQGIKVGSSEAQLKKAYPHIKKQPRGGLYAIFSLGGRKGADFYVKQGLVTQILIRDYN